MSRCFQRKSLISIYEQNPLNIPFEILQVNGIAAMVMNTGTNRFRIVGKVDFCYGFHYADPDENNCRCNGCRVICIRGLQSILFALFIQYGCIVYIILLSTVGCE